MSTCFCGTSFDPDLNYAGEKRKCGPIRRFCSLACGKLDHSRSSQNKESVLRRRYGLSLEEYNQFLEVQDHKCAICRQPETTVNGRWGYQFSLAVDHDHETGQVRGLLCTPCNRGIGFLRDNPELLRVAANYLEKR